MSPKTAVNGPGAISAPFRPAPSAPARPRPRRRAARGLYAQQKNNAGAFFEGLKELRLEADRVDIARAGQAAVIFIPAARIGDSPAVNLIVRLTAAAESRLVAQLAARHFERNYPANVLEPFLP